MMKNDKASLSVRRIAFIAVLLIFLLSMGVMATNLEINSIKIILSNNYELNVLTTKTKVSEVLEENHIVVLPEETVVPNLDAEISQNKVVTITKASQNESNVIKLAQENSEVSMEQLLGNYTQVKERIITEQVEIPYETITKDASQASENATNKVIKQGKNGLKEITYRAKFRNEVEIERTVLSETIIREPVNKIVQVNNKVTTSRAGSERSTNNPASTANTTLAKKVAGKTPIVKTFNTSAYCSCSKCCGKTTGITSSGAKATSWYTLAASTEYPIGTIIYIPYFKNKPNGGWFVVQDRGGSIKNNKLDVYMGTHSQAIQFGRRSLECYVYM